MTIAGTTVVADFTVVGFAVVLVVGNAIIPTAVVVGRVPFKFVVLLFGTTVVALMGIAVVGGKIVVVVGGSYEAITKAPIQYVISGLVKL